LSFFPFTSKYSNAKLTNTGIINVFRKPISSVLLSIKPFITTPANKSGNPISPPPKTATLLSFPRVMPFSLGVIFPVLPYEIN